MGLLEDLRQAHLDEPCPNCNAQAGKPCKTPSGRKAGKPHADRIHNGNILFKERLESGYYDEASG